MCNLYRMISNIDAMRRLFAVAGPVPNLPLYPEIYPDREAPVIRADATGARRVELARWGVPPPGDVGRPVTNVRNLTSPFWRASLTGAERRCLVPVTAFCEWTAEPDPATGRKRKVWFEMMDSEPFAFAGIVRPTASDEPDRFAFLTCAANTVVGTIHPKAVPVILHRDTEVQWLNGAPAGLLAQRDVTPGFHPAATRDRPVLSRMSADEATGGVNPARCFSSAAANAAGVA